MGSGAVRTVGVLLAAALIVGGAALIAWGIPMPSRAIDAADATDFSNEAQTVYAFTDLTIADSYAEGDDTVYVVGVMSVASDTSVTVSLELPVTDPLYTRLMTYLNDDAAYYGDFCVSCYVQYVGNLREEDQKAYYRESAAAVASYYEALSLPLEISTDHFRYLCTDKEDYTRYLDTSSAKPLIGVGMIVLAGYSVIRLWRKPKVTAHERQASTEW